MRILVSLAEIVGILVLVAWFGLLGWVAYAEYCKDRYCRDHWSTYDVIDQRMGFWTGYVMTLSLSVAVVFATCLI